MKAFVFSLGRFHLVILPFRKPLMRYSRLVRHRLTFINFRCEHCGRPLRYGHLRISNPSGHVPPRSFRDIRIHCDRCHK